jgi:2'-5' RNA ligase
MGNLITEGNRGEEFGYLGVHFMCDTDSYKEMLEEFFEQEDLYEEFGIEEEPHVTVLYGFEPSVKAEDIKPVMEDKVIKSEDIVFTDISMFENDEYDVLKLSVESDILHKYNEFFTENFPYQNDFPDYKPHLTIGYVKKGLGQKYIDEKGDDIKEAIEVFIEKCDINYQFSDSEKNKTFFSIICK